jgi:ABC-type multidrug transport system fused ATPase/permease subunit
MESEHLVREALKRVMVGRTCFIIAHRISTIINSDLILVIDGGRVVATGRHSELIESSPVYERLYNLQFQDEGAEVLEESGAA